MHAMRPLFFFLDTACLCQIALDKEVRLQVRMSGRLRHRRNQRGVTRCAPCAPHMLCCVVVVKELRLQVRMLGRLCYTVILSG
jgi:hypothetical protein